MRRTKLFLAACAALMAGAMAAPVAEQAPLCPSMPVELQLHPSATLANAYKLVFNSQPNNARDANMQPDFVDIHYRVNNEDSINLRVMTQTAVTMANTPAKIADVDNIRMRPGDALRAYATYSAKGYACDTPVHTFNAPESSEMNADINNINNFRSVNNNNINNANNNLRNLNNNARDQFFAAAAEEARAQQAALCPSIPLKQDVVKIAGLENTYMLSFTNESPASQLHYVDLHLSTDADKGWDNLRLGSDMQLSMAHSVMQPGVVVAPHEVLRYYWSYRTADANTGDVVDCTTPIQAVTPQQITHEVSMQQLQKAANSQQ